MGVVEDVALGATHACALIADTVWCWGDGSQGQLGTGDSPQSMQARREPQPVPGIEGAVAIAAGFAHTCAVLEDERVACWGNNDAGQIGAGDAVIAEPRIVWDRVERPLRVTAGHSHTCVLDANLRSHCWGDNSFGQLGNGTNQPSTEPLTGGLDLLDLSASFRHTCAVETTGDVFCWGSNGTVSSETAPPAARSGWGCLPAAPRPSASSV